MVSVSISKLGLWDLIFCPSGGEDQRQLLPSYHHQLGNPLFGTQCSFVDEIKLNYGLANTIYWEMRSHSQFRTKLDTVYTQLIYYA